jgi:hypothetical protein
MLRGVNVGGNSLKMDWLRQACENLGWQNVRTYGVGSTGRRNTGIKSLCWRFKLQGLTWPFV